MTTKDFIGNIIYHCKICGCDLRESDRLFNKRICPNCE